jgi:hypothetical protein
MSTTPNEKLDKIKDKVEKLLNLSMSDNEHEAAIALERALKLMNEHNLTKEDVYKQNLITTKVELGRYILHDWIIKLCASICKISGCYLVYSQGIKKNDIRARLTIAGRESDVLNSEYLITFLIATIESKSQKYKLKIRKELGSTTQNKNHVALNSYRLGIIQAIVNKIKDQKNLFFVESTSKALVPMDDATRLKEAEEFFKSINTSEIATKKLSSHVDRDHYFSGRAAGEEINLNVGVTMDATTDPLLYLTVGGE